MDIVSSGRIFQFGNRVFYSAGTLHLDGTVDHVMDYLLDTFSLGWVMSIIHDTRVEVAIADMSKDAGKEAQAVQVLFGFF